MSLQKGSVRLEIFMQKILTLLTLVVLAACASEPPVVVKQENDPAPKINLDVLTVVVLDRTTQDGQPTPYTTNNFQPTIVNAMRRWATDKIVAVGTTGEAIIVIRDGTLKSEPIPHPDSWFTREQTSKYVGHAEIELDVTRRNEHGQVMAESSQFETLPEEASTLERQNAYNKLLNAMMRDLSANVRSGVKEHLASFVTAQTPPQ